MIPVGVVGAAGRMGRIVCATVASDGDLSLVAAVDRSNVGEPVGSLIGTPDLEVVVSDEHRALLDSGAQVAVDFTHPDVVFDNVRWYVENGVHAVIGTTGLSPENFHEIDDLLEKNGRRSNVIVAPNFALGAVLAQRFATEASRFFPAAEIIELHHEGKADAPSGTALDTARRMAAGRREAYKGPDRESMQGVRGGETEGVRIHSVRLPGLVAHQEVVFGAQGQTLSIRHDSMDRTSFMPGVVLAIKKVAGTPGLTVGLEQLLELDQS